MTLLQEDHKRVQKMFKQFEKMNREDTDAMRELVASACAELDMHAALEEELFYPALREHLDDQKVHLVDEAEIEHDSAKQLMAQLSEIEPSDPRYAATFTVLGEYVNHHIAEEENELFKLAKKVKLDLEAMGEALQEQKQQRQGGEQAETEEPEEDEETSGQAPHEIPVKEMDIEDEEDMEPSDSKRAGRR
ncbi:MAG TPA: hemerythrin domain-containing protein [Burkholderiales bacterium]|nr:hemerythrin domain-containing protein [Burkholderiales bacterium]